jgi:predicted DNA-binding transcriptional regulator YafY
MERLIRVLLALADRGDRGVSARRLALVAGYPGDTESGLAALRRDLRRLRQVGWDIESLGDNGQDGRYVLHARDNRMAQLLSPGEQAALQQALRESDAEVPRFGSGWSGRPRHGTGWSRRCGRSRRHRCDGDLRRAGR